MIKQLTALSVLAISSASFAQTEVPNTFQAGTPARAAEVNANFDALEAAIDQNASDLQGEQAVQNDRLDALELNSNTSVDALDFQALQISRLESAIEYSLRNTPCGDYKLFGCNTATSAIGDTFDLQFESTRHMLIMYPDSGTEIVIAIPVTASNFQQLWIGGSANLSRPLTGRYGNALVDNCDNPTVMLFPTGEPVSNQVSVNSGNLYRVSSYTPLETVDVTGGTYGFINLQTEGNIVEACTTVNNATGLYDSYTIDLQFNVSEARFNSPWIYQ